MGLRVLGFRGVPLHVRHHVDARLLQETTGYEPCERLKSFEAFYLKAKAIIWP